MKIDRTECPRCNSSQKFAPRERPVDGGRIEVYVRCSKCNWTDVLEVTTSLIRQAERKERKIRERARWERSRHGYVSISTDRAWNKALDHLRDLRAALEEENSGSATNS